MFTRAERHAHWYVVALCCLAVVLATPRLDAQGSLGGVVGATVAGGLLIDVVPAGSAGALAGLQHGDIVNAFNGAKVASLEGLQHLLQQSRPGAKVTLGIIRGGREYQAAATLQAPVAIAPADDPLQRRLNDHQRETDDLRKQIEAANAAKAAGAARVPTVHTAPAIPAPHAAGGAGIPSGIYNCRSRTVNGYNVVLTIRIKDAGNYTVVGDHTERPGEYRFDSQRNTVTWLSGPLKANTVDNNRAADYEQERIPPAKVLTVFRGFTATRCILSE